MRTLSRYRLNWWLVCLCLVVSVMVNPFMLSTGPMAYVAIFPGGIYLLIVLGSVSVVWLLSRFLNIRPTVWVTPRQYALGLAAVCLVGISPTIYVYGGSILMSEQILRKIESNYKVTIELSRRGPLWSGSQEWGPGLIQLWRTDAIITVDDPRQFMADLVFDLEEHGWKAGRKISPDKYALSCDNAPFPPSYDVNFIAIEFLDSGDTEGSGHVEVTFSFDNFSPFDARCRL